MSIPGPTPSVAPARSTIERAFEIARTGEAHSIRDIERWLSAERYSNVAAHLAGRSIRAQLMALMITAVGPAVAMPAAMTAH
ncbi:MAG: hypothetical protein JWN66_111 [Sphingomonas bacterium]|nr:hypothetical protein [Sphingomonas bacterium]